MATVVRENIGLLHDKLTIKVNKEDYFPSFEKTIKEYSKKANIPGFRKGMVPAGMIRKMYGASILADEVIRSVEKELYQYLDTEKPSIFAQPLPLENKSMNHMDINNPAEHEFSFEMGLQPDFQLADLSKAPVTFYKVTVTDAMIDDEISHMQQKMSTMTEPDVVGNEDETILDITWEETDKDGNSLNKKLMPDYCVEIKKMTELGKNLFTGKKIGDQILLQLNEAFKAENLPSILEDLELEKDSQEDSKKYFKITIDGINFLEISPINEEFFKKAYPSKDITSEEELRNTLREEIQQYWDTKSRYQLQDQLYHYLLDNTHMDFPAEFLKRWLQNGGDQPKTSEQAEKEYPNFVNQLKWTLITNKITEANQLKATNEELRDSIRAEVSNYFGSMGLDDDNKGWLDSYVDSMMKNKKHLDRVYHRVITEKLFNWLESQVSPTQKEVTADEFEHMQQHHEH